jgi:hypothetical protein
VQSSSIRHRDVDDAAISSFKWQKRSIFARKAQRSKHTRSKAATRHQENVTQQDSDENDAIARAA